MCNPEYLTNTSHIVYHIRKLPGYFNISQKTFGNLWQHIKGGIFINYFDKLVLIDELSKAANEGAVLYINDEVALPETIARMCMEESAVYMPDYVMDQSGSLVEIRFDKVKDC